MNNKFYHTCIIIITFICLYSCSSDDGSGPPPNYDGSGNITFEAEGYSRYAERLVYTVYNQEGDPQVTSESSPDDVLSGFDDIEAGPDKRLVIFCQNVFDLNYLRGESNLFNLQADQTIDLGVIEIENFIPLLPRNRENKYKGESITFEWWDVAGTDQYRLQIAEGTVLEELTPDTEYIVSNFADLLADPLPTTSIQRNPESFIIFPDTGQDDIDYADIIGEDSEISTNPPSYSRFYSNGGDYSSSTMEQYIWSVSSLDEYGNESDNRSKSIYIIWGMVKDDITGLVWTSRLEGEDIYSWTEIPGFLEELNNPDRPYGGLTGWRLPTIKELSTIIDSGNNKIAINQIDFLNIPDDTDFWSATEFADNTNKVWTVNFGTGRFYNQYEKIWHAQGGAPHLNVIAVNGEHAGWNIFTDNGDGTITDSVNGLMWQKTASAEKKTWVNAFAYCNSLDLGGHDIGDWRVPSRNELQSIVDYERYQPAISPDYFSDTQSDKYWTSTTYVLESGYENNAWLVDFSSGSIETAEKTQTHYIRAVRTISD